MTIQITAILLILLLHWLADFLLQSDWMALNKSHNSDALMAHTTVYALCFLPFFGTHFALVTWATHTVTDAITSRVNAKLWQENQRHWFFVAVGLDQLIHYIMLLGTYTSLFGG